MFKPLEIRIVLVAALAAMSLLITHPTLAVDEPPAQGGTLPAFELTVPEDDGARSYLGLPASGQFTVPEIKAQVVIIEIFNMY